MNKNLSILAQDLIFSITSNDAELPESLNFLSPQYLREINEAYPNFLSYQLKRKYGLLRIFNADEEERLRSSEIKELKANLNSLSKELRYKQLLKLREKIQNSNLFTGRFPVNQMM